MTDMPTSVKVSIAWLVVFFTMLALFAEDVWYVIAFVVGVGALIFSASMAVEEIIHWLVRR